jgi:integrase
MPDHSSSNRRPRKDAGRPKKPYPDFPLTPHASGAWQKKIRGKIHYFGRWARRVNGKVELVEGDGWKEALEEYKAVADDLHAGRTPRAKGDGLTVADLCNHFLTAKLRQREAGELGTRSFGEYKQTTDMLVSAFGKTRLVGDLAADDFEKLRAAMAERWGPVRLGTEIQKVRTVFKYGCEAGLLDQPIRYGPQFKKPAAGVMRRHRARAGEKMLEAAQIRALLHGALVVGAEGPKLVQAGPQLKAMILLGINCGFGNTDCTDLPLKALDLDGGWVNYPRPKTGIPRRCPLWPETVAALHEALARRPEPKDPAAADRAFVNQRGALLVCIRETNRTDGVSVAFGTLLKRAGLHREGLGFYTLRHVFRTVADAARDPVAIDLIMGHSDPSMAAHYRERVDDARLVAVTNHVRRWLYGDDGGQGGEPEATASEGGPADAPRQAEGEERPPLRLQLYVG